MFDTLASHRESAIRVLLVEDNETNRRLLVDYLTFTGYAIWSIADGSEFFAALAECRPDIILLDLKLPTVDGYTLLEQLQQDVQWQSIPVIVVSALAFKADRQRALALGACRYLVKPVGLEHLRQVIAEEIQMRQSPG